MIDGAGAPVHERCHPAEVSCGESHGEGEADLMELTELLRERSDDLVAEAMAELRQAHLKHYEAESRSTVRERLATLLDLTLQCLSCGRADSMIDYTTRVARERFAGGYDLLEVQTAMNVLEETLWKRILASMEP